ncbi:sugar transporter ERD6-like 9 [Papilio machaon]|uniref:sugar transporter ERD6-like 9 n=1 Tax=Papilio machaon TaxID=76193 RepID=UPI001E6648FA|nr:sugar transporter ERD6-like 9 [Papilio machaon]
MDFNERLHNVDGQEKKWLPSKLFLKQLFISVGVWNMLFLGGMCMGTPTVLIPQLRRDANSTDAVDDETASWLYSVFGTCTLPWVVITLLFTQYFGRRWPVIISVFTIFLVFLFMSLSSNAKQILVAEIMEGCFLSCCLTVCVIILSEYTIPKYRGIFLCFKSSSFFWGIWIANIIGTFFHWRNIPILGMIVCFYSLTAFFWPESPHWLASKGRFEECKASYRWLHGCGVESERDLAILIKRQTDYLNIRAEKRKSFYYSQYTSKEFYKPLFLIILAVTQYHFSGNCGPMIMTTSVYGEVIPLKHKTSMFLVAILLFETYNAILLKNAPKLFKNLGFHETKDKTLQQIEQDFEEKSRAPTPSIDETELFIAKQTNK